MLWLAPWFFIPATTAPVLLLVGAVMFKNPPQKPNAWYGYRTRRSRSSQPAWEFSQKVSAKRMMWSGVVLLLSGIPGLFVVLPEGAGVTVGLLLVLLATFVPILWTEQDLKRRFGDQEEGDRTS